MSGPISMFVPAALMAVLAVPLALQVVPPNRYYGFRTARTLADREVWFRVNRFAGWALLIAASIAGGLYLSVPELASGESLAGVLALVVPTLAALVATSIHARRVAQ
jgi:uncharacterized membrane protein